MKDPTLRQDTEGSVSFKIFLPETGSCLLFPVTGEGEDYQVLSTGRG